MSNWSLVIGEKSMLVNQDNFFVIKNTDPNYKVNKIELTKKLKKIGLDAIRINVCINKSKIKKRGKKQNLINKFRPKKYYVKLKSNQKLDEEKLKELN